MGQLILVVLLIAGLAFMFPAAIPGVVSLVRRIGIVTALIIGSAVAFSALATIATFGFAIGGSPLGTMISGAIALFSVLTTILLFGLLARGAAMGITIMFGSKIRSRLLRRTRSLYFFISQVLIIWAAVVGAIIALAIIQESSTTLSVLDFTSILALLTFAMMALYWPGTYGVFRVITTVAMIFVGLFAGAHWISTTNTVRVVTNNSHAVHQGWVNTNLGTGKVYYTTTRPTRIWNCHCAEDSKGNVTVVTTHSNSKPTGRNIIFEAISRKALPTEVNGISVIAVHPPIDTTEWRQGWDQNTVVLVPAIDVVAHDDPVEEKPTAPVIQASAPPARIRTVVYHTGPSGEPRSTPAPPKPAVESFIVDIPAEGGPEGDGWVDSDHDLMPNESLSCVIEGHIDYMPVELRAGRSQPYATPVGTNYVPTDLTPADAAEFRFNRPDIRVAAAVVQVGSVPFAYHEGFIIQGGGHIWLSVNTRRNKSFNSGSYRATCTIRR